MEFLSPAIESCNNANMIQNSEYPDPDQYCHSPSLDYLQIMYECPSWLAVLAHRNFNPAALRKTKSLPGPLVTDKK